MKYSMCKSPLLIISEKEESRSKLKYANNLIKNK